MTLRKEAFIVSTLANELQDEFNLLLKTRPQEAIIECNTEVKINADKYKLKRAVQNIARNSFEAFEQNGIEQGKLTIIFEADKSHLSMTLRDNAGGIPPDVLEHIFSPFKASEKSSGSGLGCAVAHQVVEAHAGTISIERISQGTQFTLILPLNPQPY